MSRAQRRKVLIWDNFFSQDCDRTIVKLDILKINDPCETHLKQLFFIVLHCALRKQKKAIKLWNYNYIIKSISLAGLPTACRKIGRRIGNGRTPPRCEMWRRAGGAEERWSLISVVFYRKKIRLRITIFVWTETLDRERSSVMFHSYYVFFEFLLNWFIAHPRVLKPQNNHLIVFLTCSIVSGMMCRAVHTV